MRAALTLTGVSKAYAGAAVLQDIALSVGQGEYITILGPSGAGKSTMLRLIAGFERPDRGRVWVGTEDVTAKPAHARGIGVVFQSFALFPHLNVFDNVAFGLRYRAEQPVLDDAKVRAAVLDVLQLVGLKGFERRQVTEISGGQKQRVALARCLVSQPKLVLLDEPLGALDANLRNQMTTELARIQRQIGATFLHVTGNEQEALAMGDRVAVLDGGSVVQFDAPRALFERPATPRIAQLLNAYNHVTEGESTWLIRNDLVHVEPLDADAEPRARGGTVAAIRGQYVASEYAGSRVLALFDVGAGRHFEVEYHLGHSRPPALEAGHSYTLRWNPADAQMHPVVP